MDQKDEREDLGCLRWCSYQDHSSSHCKFSACCDAVHISFHDQISKTKSFSLHLHREMKDKLEVCKSLDENLGSKIPLQLRTFILLIYYRSLEGYQKLLMIH